ARKGALKASPLKSGPRNAAPPPRALRGPMKLVVRSMLLLVDQVVEPVPPRYLCLVPLINAIQGVANQLGDDRVEVTITLRQWILTFEKRTESLVQRGFRLHDCFKVHDHAETNEQVFVRSLLDSHVGCLLHDCVHALGFSADLQIDLPSEFLESRL